MGRMRLWPAVARLAAAFAAAAAVALAALPLVTCSNPVDLVEKVTVEVMKGNDRYLEIEAFTPSTNLSNVDPGSAIRLTLDKPIDVATISEEMVKIEFTVMEGSPPVPVTHLVPWIATYNSDSRVLSLRPNPYLEDSMVHTVTVKGLMSSDGSRQYDPVSWSFETGVAPKGSIKIGNQTHLGDIGYTNSSSTEASVVISSNADEWCASVNPFAIIDNSLAWVSVATPVNLTLSSPSQGDIAIYAAFRKASESKYGCQTEGLVRYDTIAPAVGAMADRFVSAAITLDPGVTETNPKTYSWTVQSGSALTFGSQTAASTSVSATVDGTRIVRLTAIDRAGNSGFGSCNFTWDSSPPLPPSVASPSPTVDSSPTWTWSSGGGGGGTLYRYQLNTTSGVWTGPTTDTSYTSGALSDGLHTLYVQQRDITYDYYSAYGSRTVRVTKVIPYAGQTEVSRTPTLQWRSVFLALSYSIEVYNGREGWSTIASGLSGTSYTVPALSPLPGLTTITWRVAASSKGGTTYLPTTSGSTFTTRK